MKTIKEISKNSNYTAVNIGKLNNLDVYSLIHPKNGQEVRGKVFLKEVTKATGTEISVQTLPAKTELPYFHIHEQNEETYIVLKGFGFFQVDNDCFPVEEGSVVRIAPSAKRGFCNTSDEPMVLIVIQSRQNSLEQYSADDGERVKVGPKWRDN